MRQFLVFMAIPILLAACPSATPAGCQPSKIQVSKDQFHEIQADMQSKGEVWALLFFETARTDEDEKIVWRITGESDQFQAQAESEDGTILQPSWVEYHGGSNWHRPGQEWGTGFKFPTPGCWKITVRRDTTVGTIALDMAAAEQK